MKVYKLKADGDRFQSLVPLDRTNSIDVFRRFDGTPMGDSWRPWPVEIFTVNTSQPKSDSPLLATNVPAFSARAAEALHELLIPNGELLPLSCADGSYFAYNVTNVVDALDSARSSFIRYSDGGIMDVSQYQFLENLIGTIFKIPQTVRMDVFVSDEFKLAVEAHKLIGFDFELAWNSFDRQ